MRKLAILFLIVFLPLLGWAADAPFSIHVIDVGQGDAILLEFEKAAILIDAGGEATDDQRYKEHLLSELTAFFKRRPDLHYTLQALIVTHPHIDHTRFVMDVLNNEDSQYHFVIRHLYDGGDTKGSGAPQLRAARKFASDRGIDYAAIRDDVIGQEGLIPAGLKNLSPGADIRFLAGSRDCANGNNNSLVVRAHYGNKTALLTGDSETGDDEDCEEGQVEHLLERYEGTDLLRADVYKVGHHGSHNGTDEAFVSAVSPAIALISAGHRETRAPGTFHAFFFGHPREDVVELLEATTANRNPPVGAYTYLKGTRNRDATNTVIEGRLIAKAIYCTCWDGDLTVSTDSHGEDFSVIPATPHPIQPEYRPGLMNVVETHVQPSAQAFQFAGASLAMRADPSSQGITTESVILFSLVLLLIYIVMRVCEIFRERRAEELAQELIIRTPEELELTRFELRAFIRRNDPKKRILRSLWPRLRISIDDVVERAVAQLIRNDLPDRKAKIDALRKFHSNADDLPALPPPLPSTLFIVAAATVVVLFFAIQAVPPVGGYLTTVFHQSPFLEELWTGLLATVVGASATVLGKKSTRRQAESASIKSQIRQKSGTQESDHKAP